MENILEEVQRNFENRFDAPGYKKAIEWLACFIAPGVEDFELFVDGVVFVADKYNQGNNTVLFDATVYSAEAHR